MEQKDGLGLFERLHPEGQQESLDRQGGQEQEIIARQRGVAGIREIGGDQQGAHEAPEEAGPALLDAEPKELVEAGGKGSASLCGLPQALLGLYEPFDRRPEMGGAFRTRRGTAKEHGTPKAL